MKPANVTANTDRQNAVIWSSDGTSSARRQIVMLKSRFLKTVFHDLGLVIFDLGIGLGLVFLVLVLIQDHKFRTLTLVVLLTSDT